jgi:RNA polymerase sigma factor (sigma-70 family)
VSLQQGGDGPGDAELLESFLTRRDEAAFEALLRRHGPMVLGVCRRVLGNLHDAEDAFQATFLVLVRKAAGIRPRELVGNWLYGVAHRTAMKARAMSSKRHTREREAGANPRHAAPADEDGEELLALLDLELSRLPERYRVPVVLCELEGKGRKEVARLLGLPEGTLSWRLAQARKLLARRLARHGVPCSAGALAAVLSQGTASARVPASLLTATGRAGRPLVAGAVPARVLALTEGVVKTMLLHKLKVFWAVALAVVVGAGVAGLAYRAMAAEPKQGGDVRPAAQGKARVALDELEALRLEIEALRKGLQATRARVKLLEAEVQTLRGGKRAAQADLERKKEFEHLKDLEELRARDEERALHALNELDGKSERHASPTRSLDKLLTEALGAFHKLQRDPRNKEALDRLAWALEHLKKQTARQRKALVEPRK